MPTSYQSVDEVRRHVVRGRSVGKQVELAAMAVEAERQRYQRWRLALEGYLYRAQHAPLVPTLLSERLILGGPTATVNWYPRSEQLRQSAARAMPATIARLVQRAATEAAERRARIAALTGADPEPAELLVPTRELVLPGAGALEVADFSKPPTRGA